MNFQRYWNETRDNNTDNKFTCVLLAIYLITLFWILLLKLGVQFSYRAIRSVNLIPFSESGISNSETISNVVIFLPFGIYIGVLFEQWTFWKQISLFFLVSLLIEVLQLILMIGAFDTTDLITNTSGGIIGLMLFVVTRELFKSSVKAQKFINVVSAIGTLTIIVLLVLLKMDMLPVKYR